MKVSRLAVVAGVAAIAILAAVALFPRQIRSVFGLAPGNPQSTDKGQFHADSQTASVPAAEVGSDPAPVSRAPAPVMAGQGQKLVPERGASKSVAGNSVDGPFDVPSEVGADSSQSPMPGSSGITISRLHDELRSNMEASTLPGVARTAARHTELFSKDPDMWSADMESALVAFYESRPEAALLNARISCRQPRCAFQLQHREPPTGSWPSETLIAALKEQPWFSSQMRQTNKMAMPGTPNLYIYLTFDRVQ
jgi:hypothetical protein